MNPAPISTEQRIAKILEALGTLAAELGPLWFHSTNGKAIQADLTGGLLAAGMVASQLGAQTPAQ